MIAYYKDRIINTDVLNETHCLEKEQIHNS